MGFKHLTEEDMEWIDENVKEEKDTITNKGTEPSSPCKPTGELNNSVATNTHPNAS